jgi:hypothetical protein
MLKLLSRGSSIIDTTISVVSEMQLVHLRFRLIATRTPGCQSAESWCCGDSQLLRRSGPRAMTRM